MMLKMPLEEAPKVDLIIEVSSSPLSSTLDVSTTMYQMEVDTFPEMFDIMAYFEGQENSICFSTSKNISEFSVSNIFIIGSEWLCVL